MIPVVGSYELRSLSRSHTASVSSAPGLHAAHRSADPHSVNAPVAPGGINAVYPQDLAGPDALGAARASVGSLARGPGAATLPRRASFGSSEAFGGGVSAMSVAGSDDESASQVRAALPPLASLPRISRDGAPSPPRSFSLGIHGVHRYLTP